MWCIVRNISNLLPRSFTIIIIIRPWYSFLYIEKGDVSLFPNKTNQHANCPEALISLDLLIRMAGPISPSKFSSFYTSWVGFRSHGDGLLAWHVATPIQITVLIWKHSHFITMVPSFWLRLAWIKAGLSFMSLSDWYDSPHIFIFNAFPVAFFMD